VKDLARMGRNPRLDYAPEQAQTRPDARQILHPAKAGVQDDAILGGWRATTPYKLSFLLAADDQAVDADGWASHRAAKFEVAGDFRNVEEHLFQISRHRDLFDGIGQLAP
jgi:hypothetical protein